MTVVQQQCSIHIGTFLLVFAGDFDTVTVDFFFKSCGSGTLTATDFTDLADATVRCWVELPVGDG